MGQVESDSVPAGNVVGTEPAEGSERRAGSDVKLLVSKGPRMASVPDVRGKSEAEARSTLQAAGFQVRNASRRNAAVEKDHVISTTPQAGARVRHDQAVDLAVSNGPAEVQLPDITGESEASARSELESAGLEVKTTETYDADVPKGSVVTMTPGAGTKAHTGDTIALAISKGQEMVDVPDVVGKKADEARQTLEDAGFSVSGGSWLENLLGERVKSQSPEGGSGHQAPKGSGVSLSF